jgi:hypothetical protein
MSHAVIPRLLTAEVPVRSQTLPCGICGGRSGTGTGFNSEYFDLPLTVSFHQCSMLIFIYTLSLSRGQRGEVWDPSKEQCSFGNRGASDVKLFSVFHNSSRLLITNDTPGQPRQHFSKELKNTIGHGPQQGSTLRTSWLTECQSSNYFYIDL